ncbi:MAG: hypothetical protein HY075_02420, partial [Deltaproteobacteria bacterium]|nr:hypothetical protein [Deltaproteobacteria bacterium]
MKKTVLASLALTALVGSTAAFPDEGGIGRSRADRDYLLSVVSTVTLTSRIDGKYVD